MYACNSNGRTAINDNNIPIHALVLGFFINPSTDINNPAPSKKYPATGIVSKIRAKPAKITPISATLFCPDIFFCFFIFLMLITLLYSSNITTGSSFETLSQTCFMSPGFKFIWPCGVPLDPADFDQSVRQPASQIP